MWFWFYQLWFRLDVWLDDTFNGFCFAACPEYLALNTFLLHKFICCFFVVGSFVNAVCLSLWLGICMLIVICCQSVWLLKIVIVWFLSHQMQSIVSVILLFIKPVFIQMYTDSLTFSKLTSNNRRHIWWYFTSNPLRENPLAAATFYLSTMY